MPWIVALIAGVLAIVGLRSRPRRRHMRRATDPEFKKKKKERVVLALEPGGTQGIRLVEEAPSILRARGGRQVRWLVDVDDTDGRRHTVSIAAFEEDGQSRSQDDIFQSGANLSVVIKPDSKGKVERIEGTLNSRLQTHRITYQVLIDDDPAEIELEKGQRASAERGALLVCPVWPCD